MAAASPYSAALDGNILLQFGRQDAYGFCPSETNLFSAVIVADEDGAYTFCGTELVEAPDWCPDCVRAVPGPSPCLVDLSLARRILTTEQVHRLHALLAAVPEAICDDNPTATDWCIISVYEFLGQRESAVCTYGYINPEFSAAIGLIDAFLRELRSAG